MIKLKKRSLDGIWLYMNGGRTKMNEGRLKAFGTYHPLVLMVYFVSVLLVTMFTTNPVLLTLALLGGISFCAVLQRGRKFFSNLAFFLPLFLLIALTNPLFSHNGVTPLFFLNGNPVTLEAVLYGVYIAAMLLAVIYWCKCYNEIMTSDKFLYLFGKAIPKLSLVLSMALRFIPLLKNQIKKVSKAQKAMGLYSSGNYVDKLRGGISVFSSIITWALENAVETGSSMKARGYGLKGRSTFSLFRFTINDSRLLIITVLLLIFTGIGIASKVTAFSFYPEITKINLSITSILVYLVFGILSLLPFIIEVKENLKWKYFRSKI